MISGRWLHAICVVVIRRHGHGQLWTSRSIHALLSRKPRNVMLYVVLFLHLLLQRVAKLLLFVWMEALHSTEASETHLWRHLGKAHLTERMECLSARARY